jgi:hypothetical protein
MRRLRILQGQEAQKFPETSREESDCFPIGQVRNLEEKREWCVPDLSLEPVAWQDGQDTTLTPVVPNPCFPLVSPRKS